MTGFKDNLPEKTSGLITNDKNRPRRRRKTTKWSTGGLFGGGANIEISGQDHSGLFQKAHRNKNLFTAIIVFDILLLLFFLYWLYLKLK